RHWSGMAERGAYCGLRFLAAAYRLTGRYGCMVALLPIALYFHLTGGEQRRASRLFLQRAYKALGNGREPSRFDGLKHSLGFARKAVETFAAWSAVSTPMPSTRPTRPKSIASRPAGAASSSSSRISATSI
ncbi:MAG TPA: hypothetical protein VF502_05515, partial [Stellaceae bacterium]